MSVQCGMMMAWMIFLLLSSTTPADTTDFVVGSAAGDDDLRSFDTIAYTHYRRGRNKRFGMTLNELYGTEGEFKVEDRRRQGGGGDFNTTTSSSTTAAAKSSDGFIDDLSTHSGA